MTNWDLRFYALAEHIAKWSKDPRTKVGAVLVGRDKRDVALGYNGFPSALPDHPEFLGNSSLKYAFMLHAERNVLDNARFDTRGSCLYVTKFPCSECMKSIFSKEIRRVVSPLASGEKWVEDAKLVFKMLEIHNGEFTWESIEFIRKNAPISS